MKLNKVTIDQLRMLGGNKLIDYKGKMIISDHIAQEYLFEEPCRIDAVTILICKSGTLNYVVNLEQNSVTDSSILINMPENIIQFKSAENLEAYAILISSDMIRSLPYDTLQRASKYLPMEQLFHAHVPLERIKTIKPYFDLLKTCIDQPMQETDEIVKMLLQAFLVTVVGMVRENRTINEADHGKRVSKGSNLLYERFRELLSKHHQTERTVQFYAEKLCVTPKYLSMAVKEYSGRKPLEWISDYVIAEAKSLLYYSQIPAQEVAFRLNFPSQSAFGKFFKQKTGYSPRQYAKLIENTPQPINHKR